MAARTYRPIRIEVMRRLDEVDEALGRADVVLADNMSIEDIRETVRRTRGRARVEVRRVTLDVSGLRDGAEHAPARSRILRRRWTSVSRSNRSDR